MLSEDAVLKLQKEQYQHDKRNHQDILSLHKTDRLKHYGLHYCKYVGRLARGPDEEKSTTRTAIDMLLVCLSAANTLHQRLGERAPPQSGLPTQIDVLRPLADAAGRFADACEKIDHLEEFVSSARQANIDVFEWILSFARERDIDLLPEVVERRLELRERQFYIDDAC
jgi:hypothetical protein